MTQIVVNLPTNEQILQVQKYASSLPQVTNMVTEHFFVPGMYCRKVWRQQGTLIVGKVHKAHHFFVCVSGQIMVWSTQGQKLLNAGDVVESAPGTKRVTYAMQDSIGMTIHKTDLTDLDEIENELIEPEFESMYDSRNELTEFALKQIERLQLDSIINKE